MEIVKCKICGCDLKLDKENHYISRDDTVSGIACIAKSEEPTLYDTFDCLKCGCQNVMQKRNRNFNSDVYRNLLGNEVEENEDE